jgi:hypothetical protein
MKISKLAAATLIPATVAGVALTAVPFAQAAPAAPAHTRIVHHATPAKPQHVRHHRAHHAHAVARPAAKDAATTPAQDSQAATTPAESSTVSQPLSAGMSSFEQCVAWRESGDNPIASSAGLFGILPSTWAQLGYSGTAGQASVSLQKVAFTRLYAEYGAQPWAPSDGC